MREGVFRGEVGNKVCIPASHPSSQYPLVPKTASNRGRDRGHSPSLSTSRVVHTIATHLHSTLSSHVFSLLPALAAGHTAAEERRRAAHQPPLACISTVLGTLSTRHDTVPQKGFSDLCSSSRSTPNFHLCGRPIIHANTTT
jgi:hypothetical protein